MPKPRAYVPPKGYDKPITAVLTAKTPRDGVQERPRPSLSSNLDNLPLDKRTGHNRPVPDMSSTATLSIDKHVDKQKYKIVYILDKLTDDLARAASSPRKKDKEYIKGLVWSVGVLFDKLANGSQQDALVIRIPARLLENVKTVIGIQAQKKAQPIDVTPTALDTMSSGSTIESIGYHVPVAQAVAHDGPGPSLDATSLDKSMT